jgi:hypothetical protein
MLAPGLRYSNCFQRRYAERKQFAACDGWTTEGTLGWDYESLLPYFIKAEANERERTSFAEPLLGLGVLSRGQSGRLRVEDARALLSLRRRQVFRWLCSSNRTVPKIELVHASRHASGTGRGDIKMSKSGCPI